MAGLEERLSKLESILHRLFCCDTNQFTGPQGPPGAPGTPGIQGPPGVDGLITFQNLNWVGDWVPCVIYDQFDAVSYDGSSYFMNCESSTTYECETPDMNPSCWILLANAGATGPQGPTGLAGNDGSNSGRWQYLTTTNFVGAPSANYFCVNINQLNLISTLVLNQTTFGGDYLAWLSILDGLDYNSSSPAFLQITQVGNNNITAVYEVTFSNGFVSPSVLSLELNFIGGQSVPLDPTKQYTISWVLNGLGGTVANKTVGSIAAINIPGEELIYDYNIVTSRSKTACVYLPNTTQIGKEVIVFSRRLENIGFYIQANSQISADPVSGTPISTGFLTTFGIDEGESFYLAVPNGNYKFTFLGNTAAGGKAFWNMEALPNTYFTNGVQFNLADASTILDNPRVNVTVATLDAATLTTLYPFLQAGEEVFAPNQPGGGKLFIKTATGWLSSPLNIVP